MALLQWWLQQGHGIDQDFKIGRSSANKKFRFYLPRDLTETRGGLRGQKSWLTARQTQIAVTRVIRDDISKQSYE